MTEAGALEAQISQQIVIAMKAHDAERTGTLRLIKNALKNKAIEKRGLLTPAEEQQALATMIKQRRDSIEQFTKGNRPELAAKEAAEIVVIEEFLPKALDEEGLRALVLEVVNEHASATRPEADPQRHGSGDQGSAGAPAGFRGSRRRAHSERGSQGRFGGIDGFTIDLAKKFVIPALWIRSILTRNRVDLNIRDLSTGRLSDACGRAHQR